MKMSDMLAERIDPNSVVRNSNVGRYFQQRGIARSLDFRRIERLPRRRWEDAPTLGELVDRMTDWLKTPNGTMRLWPVQAQALADIFEIRGAFLPIGVGQGKAPISLLASRVLNAQRPLLIIPPELRHQTNALVIPMMREHWQIDPVPRVVSYRDLSFDYANEILNDYCPDLIFLDECHCLKNPSSGRTKKFTRYMRAHPQTIVVAASGTVSNRSLRDYWHIIAWCLKDDWMPLPKRWREVCEWADALDEGVEDYKRVAPGALMTWAEPGDNARQAYRRRLTETPGVVATMGVDNVDSSLVVRLIDDIGGMPIEVTAAMSRLERTWELPDGDEIIEATDLARHMRELVMGFWYKWDPPPPQAWLAARKAWHQYVRETLKTNRRQLDTPKQVWDECQAAHEGKTVVDRADYMTWLTWRDIEKTFKPNKVSEWVSDYAIQLGAKWLHERKPGEAGIVWVPGHVDFGERLAQVAGVPYFGAGEKASIEIASTTAPAIVASVDAHGTGKNLQDRYSCNLVLCPMRSGKRWNQLLGRTHRKGQIADTVYADVGMWHPVLRDAFNQAIADAKYLEDTGCGRQKLNYCDIVSLERSL